MKLPHLFHKWRAKSSAHYDRYYTETQQCLKCGIVRQWDSHSQYFVYYRLTDEGFDD